MPYPGKPSRGCRTCRARKVKCDETKPYCLRCSHAKRECLGYRDETELVFRDQNETLGRRRPKHMVKAAPLTTTKSKNNSTVPYKGSTTGAVPLGTIDYMGLLDFANHAPAVALEIPSDIRALCGFMFNYVRANSLPYTKGFLEHLPGMFQVTPETSPMHAALAAVSLAYMGNHHHNKKWLIQAKDLYVHALSLTHDTLREGGIGDDVLMATHLFSLYETLICTPETLGAWFTHVHGAAALMKARGPSMLNSPIGSRLFSHQRTQWLVVAFQKGKKIFEMTEEWKAPWDRTNPGNTLTEIIDAIPDLVGLSEKLENNRATRTPDEIAHLLSRARRVDLELESWQRTLAETWSAEVMDRDLALRVPAHECYDGNLHFYRDPYIASMWNIYRVSRIVLHWIYGRCKAYEPAKTGLLNDGVEGSFTYNIEDRSITDLVNEICATVPYYLGYQEPMGAPRSTEEQMGSVRLRALGGHFCMWPLYICANVPQVPAEQVKWIRDRLRFISDSLGIHLASVLALGETTFPGVPKPYRL